MIDFSKYTIEEHLHRYACWTAARAASTSRFSNDEVAGFLLDCNLRENLEKLRIDGTVTHKDYRAWFVKQVESLLHCFGQYENPKIKGIFRKTKFGIAAKMVSIYIKTVEVMPSKGTSNISMVAFPPIDSILLKKLVSEKEIDILNTAWSGMEETEFMEVIEKLKNIMGDQPFWKLEYFWNLNKKGNVEISNL